VTIKAQIGIALVLLRCGVGMVGCLFPAARKGVISGVIRGVSRFGIVQLYQWVGCHVMPGLKPALLCPVSGIPERSDRQVQLVLCDGIVQGQITGTEGLHQMRITA
jgi:hypothetical protein